VKKASNITAKTVGFLLCLEQITPRSHAREGVCDDAARGSQVELLEPSLARGA
jgi:hypothetical protein